MNEQMGALANKLWMGGDVMRKYTNEIKNKSFRRLVFPGKRCMISEEYNLTPKLKSAQKGMEKEKENRVYYRETYRKRAPWIVKKTKVENYLMIQISWAGPVMRITNSRWTTKVTREAQK